MAQSGKGGLLINIVGSVSQSLLQGLDALANQLEELSKAAQEAGSSQMKKGLEQASSTVSKMYKEIDGSAKDFSKAMQQHMEETGESMEEFAEKALDAGEEGSEGFQKLAKAIAEFAKSKKGDREWDPERIKIYNEALQKLEGALGNTEDAEKEATRRADELSSALMKTARALEEMGILEAHRSFEDWVESLNSAEVAQGLLNKEIEKTANGLRPLTQRGKEILQLTDEQAESLDEAANKVNDLYEEFERLYSIDPKELDVINFQKYESDLKDLNKQFSKFKESLKLRDPELFEAMRDELINMNELFKENRKERNETIKIEEKQRKESEELAKTYEVLNERLEELESKDITAFDEEDIRVFNKQITQAESLLRKLGDSIPNDEYETLQNQISNLRRATSAQRTELRETSKAWQKYAQENEHIVNTIDALEESISRLNDQDVTAFDAEETRLYKKELGELETQLKSLRGSIPDDEVGDFQDQISNLRRRLQDTRSEWEKATALMSGNHANAMERLGDVYGRTEDNINKFRKAVRETNEITRDRMNIISERIRELEEEEKQTEHTRQEIAKLRREYQRLADGETFAEDAMERFRESLHEVTKSQSTLTAGTRSLAAQMTPLGSAFGAVNKRVKQFAAFVAAALIVQQLTQAIQVLVDVISQYDQALHNLQAILEITGAQSQVLGERMQEVANETKFAVTEVAQGVQTLGQAGLSLHESLMVLEGVTTLATGTMTSFQQVADLVTSTLNAFNLEATEGTRIADIFANAINNSKLTVDKLSTAFNYVGAAGKQAGLSLNELTGTLMTLADNGMRASTMGTGLRRMMLKMLDPSEEIRLELAAMGKEVSDLNPKMVGWEKSLENLVPILWDAERQTVNMEKAVEMFGTRAAQVAAIVVRSTADGSRAIEEAIQKTTELGSAAEMAETQERGLALMMKNLQDRVKNIAVALGEAGFTGVLKDVVGMLQMAAEAIYDFVKAHPKAVEFAAWSAAVGTLVLAFTGLGAVVSKLTVKYGYLWKKHGAVLKRAALLTGVFTGVITVLDQLISHSQEATDAAQKQAEEYAVLASEAQSWGDSLTDAFGSAKWERVIARFKDQYKDVEDQTKNLTQLIEEELGHSIETISGRAGLQRLQEAIDTVTVETLNKQIDKNVEALNNWRESVNNFNALGVEFTGQLEDMNDEGTGMYYVLTKLNKGLNSLLEATTGFTFENILDIFGKDKQELVEDYNETLESFSKNLQELSRQQDWGLKEMQSRLQSLGDEIGRETKFWKELTEVMARSTFGAAINEMRNLEVETRKHIMSLDEQIEKRKEAGESTEALEQRARDLSSHLKDQRQTFDETVQGLVKVMRGEENLDTVMQDLKNSTAITEEEFNRLNVRLAAAERDATGKAITSYDALKRKLEEFGDEIVNTYNKMDLAQKMEFDEQFSEALQAGQKYRDYLESLPESYEMTEQKINKLVKEYTRERLAEHINEINGVKDKVSEIEDAYEKTMQNVNDVFDDRKDFINQHYDWIIHQAEQTSENEIEARKGILQAERNRTNELIEISRKARDRRIQLIKEEAREKAEVYKLSAEEVKKIEEEANREIKEVNEDYTDTRVDTLKEWKSALQDAYDYAIDKQQEYADEIKDLEEEIKESREETREELYETSRSLEQDLADIREASMSEEEQQLSRLQRARKQYSESQRLIDEGEFERAKDLLEGVIDEYKDLATAAAEASEEGETSVISQAQATNKLRQAYGSLDEVVRKQGKAEVEQHQKDIEKYEEKKEKMKEFAETTKEKINEVIEKMKAINKVDLRPVQLTVRSNVEDEIDRIKMLDRMQIGDKEYTITKYVDTVEKKSAGGPVGRLMEEVQRLAGGAFLPGYGGGDKIKALLEKGEFVVRKEAVRAYGEELFHKLNNMSFNAANVPKYQTGGMVAAPTPTTSTASDDKMDMKDYGRVELEIGGRGFPVMGKKSVIEELKNQVSRENLRRSN